MMQQSSGCFGHSSEVRTGVRGGHGGGDSGAHGHDDEGEEGEDVFGVHVCLFGGVGWWGR